MNSVLVLVLALPFQTEGASAERPLRVLELSGTPHERGVAHGSALKKEIHELLGIWRKDLESSYGMPADAFIARFVEETTFEDAIEEWTPDLLEEIRGIAQGAEVSRDEIYVFQLIDEVWANARELTGKHCSSIGVNRRGEQPTIVAQNLDLMQWVDGYQTLLHITYPRESAGKYPRQGSGEGLRPKQEAFVLTLPGVIGVNGLNSDAVAITCNTLLDLAHGTSGLPVACIVRGVLERHDLADAVSFLREVPHASGQNYIVGGRERAMSLECSAHQVSEFLPYEGATLTFHTNHARVNDDRSARGAGRERPVACARFAALEKRLGGRPGDPALAPLDLAVIKSTLSSRDSERDPISNPGTYACTIMVLGDAPYLEIAPGRPHETSFRTLRFSSSGPLPPR